MRKSGAGEDGECDGDDASSDSTEPPQTLLEIDYDTVIDDEDVIDEFGLFRSLLEGKMNNVPLHEKSYKKVKSKTVVCIRY